MDLATGAGTIFLSKKFCKKIILSYSKYIKKMHYDSFLILISNSNYIYININYLSKPNSLGSDNLNWPFPFEPFRILLNYTSSHLLGLNYFVLYLFKFLIFSKNKKIQNNLIKFINQQFIKIIKIISKNNLLYYNNNKFYYKNK